MCDTTCADDECEVEFVRQNAFVMSEDQDEENAGQLYLQDNFIPPVPAWPYYHPRCSRFFATFSYQEGSTQLVCTLVEASESNTGMASDASQDADIGDRVDEAGGGGGGQH